MRGTFLAAGLAFAAVAAPDFAEAGHRRCRTCTSSGSSQWFHFNSPDAFYVPYTPKTTVASSTGPSWSTSRQVIMPAGFHPSMHYRPACVGCRAR